MGDLVILVGLLLIAGIAVYLVRAAELRRRSRVRLMSTQQADTGPEAMVPTRILRRYRYVPWLAAAGAGLIARIGFGLDVLFVVTVAIIVGLLAAQFESYLAERKKAILEMQLADSIDLMVGALQAGASAVSAMERAAEEARNPLRLVFQEMLARIRYGDDPQAVIRRMTIQVPTESFQLFGTTMAVHWEVGGSLAPTLATIGRTVRDRIEISRRIRSLTVQSRASTVAILLTTYFIAILMWRQDPVRMAIFLKSPVGSGMVAASMILQAVGIVWQASVSKVHF